VEQRVGAIEVAELAAGARVELDELRPDLQHLGVQEVVHRRRL
jgi:hypothetical protein